MSHGISKDFLESMIRDFRKTKRFPESLQKKVDEINRRLPKQPSGKDCLTPRWIGKTLALLRKTHLPNRSDLGFYETTIIIAITPILQDEFNNYLDRFAFFMERDEFHPVTNLNDFDDWMRDQERVANIRF